jgi:protein ImuB
VATPRLACIVVPLFSLAARLRSEPELAREALVVVEGNGSAARVVAASRLARRAGVRPGFTLTQARALIPKLVARARDAECERAAQEALLEIADRFSPRVEDAGEGVAYLDVEGIERRFAGEPGPELNLGRALLAAAEAASLPAKAGIASSKLAARVAAGLPESPSVVPVGQEAAFLAPLPLSRLSPLLQAGDLAATFARWGIHTIGELAGLPGSRLASRLGGTGRELHATARGIDPRPLAPRQPPAAFHEGLDLEWPLVALEPFLFVGRAALERLAQRLETNGLACARLELTLRLEPEGHQLRSIDLPAPTRDVKTLLTLLRLDLEARPPGAPLAGFSLAAHPDRPREAQLSMYGPAALSPDKLAATLARLFALLGPGRIGSPRPVDGHLPERLALVEYAPPPPPSLARDPRRITGRGLLAVRVLRPPVEIEVVVEEPPTPSPPARGPARTTKPPAVQEQSAVQEPPAAQEQSAVQEPPAAQAAMTGTPRQPAPPAREYPETRERADSPERHQGPERPEISELPAIGEPCPLPPLEIRPMVRETTASRPRIAGRVKVAAGPWGMEDEWWMPDPTGRDYWDVELTTGGLYRLYRDRASGSWYADGIYD